MQIWSDAIAGLREMRRVLKSGGTIALGFTPYSGQPNKSLTEKLSAAGFVRPRVVVIVVPLFIASRRGLLTAD